jgi:nitroimidazol reductase NimA-like FMN-containing flavoprotein (pyridoxamine 5'-phosphate oxidase superfamily)
MHVSDARTGIEVLSRETCLELLAGEVVGRVGVASHGAPRILPVNYVLDGDAVVFRTAAGTKLDDGPRAPACFEIDHFDRESRTGWSVVVLGRLEEVTQYDRTWNHVQELPIDPWAAGDKDHVLRLRPDVISGRRIA